MAGLWWSHTAPALFLAYRHCVRRQPRRNVVGQNRRRRYWRLHRPCYPKGQGQALINQEVLKAQGYCAAANIARRRGCDEAGVAGTAAAGISGQGAGGKAAKHEPTSDGWRCVADGAGLPATGALLCGRALRCLVAVVRARPLPA
jgi:hypothetical protein